MAKRQSTASKTVASAMRRRKSGTLKSSSGQRVRSRKQAIAIGLNEAREKGADVPEAPKTRRTAKRRSTRSTAGASRGAARKSTARKSTARKSARKR
jgi:hypothetical protein